MTKILEKSGCLPNLIKVSPKEMFTFIAQKTAPIKIGRNLLTLDTKPNNIELSGFEILSSLWFDAYGNVYWYLIIF